MNAGGRWGDGRWGDAALAALTTAVASWPLTRLMQEQAWVGPTFAAFVVVAGSGALARTARFPAWAVVAVQTYAAALVVSWFLVPGHHVLGVPLPSAFAAMADLWWQGVAAIQVESVPARSSPGLVLIVVMAMTAVGLAVDVIAVTLRSPALAGLPLLVVLSITASNTGQPLPARYFLVTAPVWLLLVARQGIGSVRAWAEQHGPTAAHGDVVAGRGADAGDGADVAAGGARTYRSWAQTLGVVTVLLAVLLPGVVPHLPPVALGQAPGAGRGPGFASGRVTFTDTLDLAADLRSPSRRPVLRYRTDDVRPPPLRVTVSTRYDDGRWWPPASDGASGAAQPALSPTGGPEVERATMSLTVVHNELTAPQVALPQPLGDADFGEIPWELDPVTGTVLVAGQPDSYEATYWRTTGPLPVGVGDPAALGPVDPELLRVDEASWDRVHELAATLTAGTTNQVQAAMAIQAYLRGAAFRYSLTLADPVAGPDGRTLDPLSHFLVTKQGYCVQFASAMVMLSRAHGIPARLAVGFLPGTRGADGSRTVVAADAHAWPELYITGLGWTRFEPTPGTRTGAATAYVTEQDAAAPVPTAEAPTVAPERRNGAPDVGAVKSETGGGGLSAVGPEIARAGVLALAVLLAVSVVPAAGRWRRSAGRRRAGDDAARVEGEWQALTATLADLGVAAPAGATPRQARAHYARATGLDGPSADALSRAATRLEDARYAPGRANLGTMAEDVREVATRVRSTRPWRIRLRAGLWPRSGVAALHEITAGLGEVAGVVRERVRGGHRRG
ncbi:DUF3488 and transglutaminase-like domain-containing protein [Georgenia sp. SYP-B2076]|uniref:transglutaminase TgpA family protein n=1 Tax=Georgenia sp. SYP-B2076 TaxID=2495881 RepID=UPI000F8D1C95|nr:DUF3488 and transglutaminase-like domain-containing protein [Georgenia sp. SYP-B2076]